MTTTATRSPHKKRSRALDFRAIAQFAREQYPAGPPDPTCPPHLRRWRTVAAEAEAARLFWEAEHTVWHSRIRPAYEEAVREGRAA